MEHIVRHHQHAVLGKHRRRNKRSEKSRNATRFGTRKRGEEQNVTGNSEEWRLATIAGGCCETTRHTPRLFSLCDGQDSVLAVAICHFPATSLPKQRSSPPRVSFRRFLFRLRLPCHFSTLTQRSARAPLVARGQRCCHSSAPTVDTAAFVGLPPSAQSLLTLSLIHI